MKIEQIYFRIYRPFSRKYFKTPKVSLDYDNIKLRHKEDFLNYDYYNSREEILQNKFTFLNETVTFSKSIEWDLASARTLWKYNLNYFNYLFLLSKDEQISICRNWIKSNTGIKSPGWNPYVISLRVVNWCKQGLNDKIICDSLYQQTEYLFKNIEYDILGNHLLENARALVFAGAYFNLQGRAGDWFKKGIGLLVKETRRQVLNDGVHFELSPMYHSIVLEIYLDILNILPEDHFFYPSLAKNCRNMSDFLFSITKPCGNLPLLNDSSARVAAKPSMLMEYSGKILSYAPEYKTEFKSSGYYLYKDENIYFIIDGGQIGPDYLPAHAHADIFNYELSIKGIPFIIDSGVYEYESSELRNYSRSTGAHNTVTVDNKDQAEFWGSFRVARRYKPYNCIYTNSDNGFHFEGQFSGFSQLCGTKIEHKRKVGYIKKQNKIIIEDSMSGKGSPNIKSFVHLHPGVEVISDKDKILLRVDGTTTCEITYNTNFKITDTVIFPEFGLIAKNKTIVFQSTNELPVNINYNLLLS